MGKKNITVQDFLDALEANNVPHTMGTWFKGGSEGSTSKIGAACALGQACINLGITRGSLDVINKIIPGLTNSIMTANDRGDPYYKIVELAKRKSMGKEEGILRVNTAFYYSQLK